MTASVRRVPPGRAGRLWLLDRLRSGHLAAMLLDRKLSVLRAEQRRLRVHASRTEARWHERWRDADRWAARSALLGAAREARLCQPAAAAEVTIVWTVAMGVRYPVEVRCDFPASSTSDRSPGTAALLEAHHAFLEATAAAADHAAAQAAVTTVDAEVALTRRRLRAIKDRWLPRLEASLARLNRDLDESEREQTFRLRWAATSGREGDHDQTSDRGGR